MRRSVYWVTLVLAYCSIVYELVLAQTLGALLGNTFLRYNVTIGLYLASLGAGSLLCTKASGEKGLAQLIRIEWILAALGASGPLLLFAWDAAVFKVAGALGLAFRGWAYQALIYGFDHALIVAVGILSGFELPLLMRLGGSERSEKVLAIDYGGTLIGAAAFPLLLLPHLGLLASAAATGLLNGLCALYLVRTASQKSGRDWLAPVAATALSAGLILATGPLERAVSNSLSLPFAR